MRGLPEQLPEVALSEDNVTFSGKYHHIITAAIDLVAGSAGGAATVAVGQPLDTVKVKMQTFPNLYKNALVCLKDTFMNQGIKGLYAGTIPALAANVAENAVLFCGYGVCQKVVKELVRKEDVKALNPFENATAGFLAAFFSAVALCPTELVKCRLQALKEMQSSSQLSENSIKNLQFERKRIGPYAIVKNILREDGIRGLFHGFVPTVAREMPGYFFFFGTNELTKVLLTPKGKTKDDLGLIATIIAGGLGGVSFWLAIFPLDLIKSRAQISTTSVPMRVMAKKIIQEEGVRGLYKGLNPTLIRTFPATGFMFVAYEYTKSFLNNLL